MASLEPNFPRRWSDCDMGVDARPSQPSRSLPNPAPGPLPSSLPFPSAFLNGLLSGLPRFLPLQVSKMPHYYSHSPRRYALSKPGHLPSSIYHAILSSTRASPGRKRLWRVTSGRLSALAASDRHPSGLEYEVSLEKTLWLSKATLDTKWVRRYRAGQRAVTRVRTRWSSRLQKAGSSVRLQRRSSTVA